MKKKLVFAVALVGILIGSVLGGIALADKPTGVKPIDTLGDVDEQTQAILEGVGNITDRLDDPDWGLGEIKREVAAIEGNITDPQIGLAEIKAEVEAIENKVSAIEEALGNVTQTRSFQDAVFVDDDEEIWSYSLYPDSAHFTLTLYVENLDPGEVIRVWHCYQYNLPPWQACIPADIATNGTHRFEYDSTKCQITSENITNANVLYNITVTSGG